MIATTERFTSKHYAFLGKLLFQKEPEFARQLIVNHIPSEQPTENNFKKIPLLFQNYLQIYCQYADVDSKRKFIGAMLTLYCPYIFKQSPRDMIIPRGLVCNIAAAANHSSAWASKTIYEVIVWYKSYDDFRESIEEITKTLQNGCCD